ncbi:hypothetical protein ACLOJK_007046 [Asimina triloba]
MGWDECGAFDVCFVNLQVETWKDSLLLSFQSLGVVYGRLSIAPLFVFPTFSSDEVRSVEWLYELLSFIFWTMTLIALVKYILIVIRADDNGEGGTFALYSLLCRHAKVSLLPNHQVADDELLNYEMENFPETKVKSRARRAIEKSKSSHYLMLFLALLGSCMVIANGVLTPSISGDNLISSSPDVYKLSSIFIISVHFLRWALSSDWGDKCSIHPEEQFKLFGLFALQHYGTQRIGFMFAPIVVSWLVLNGGIGSIHHVYTVMALLASIVGSQAAITSTFSIINQCLALSCFPRVKVIHTSEKIHGQVYIPEVNWILMILCISITIGFADIKHLASACGLAIITGMLITTCLMSLVITLYWERSSLISAFFLVFFGTIEVMYLSAGMLNFHKGAWFLIIFVVVLLMAMLAWHYGTMKKYEFDMNNKVSMDWLTELGPSLGVARVPGIGFIYTDVLRGIPAFFSHFVTNLPAYHQVVVFVSFKSVPAPHVPRHRQYLIGRFGPKEYRAYRCIVRYGYRDSIHERDFEDNLIMRIGEFVSVEAIDSGMVSPEGRMIVIGNLDQGGNALVPGVDSSSNACPSGPIDVEAMNHLTSDLSQVPTIVKRKRVRFQLPQKSPQMSQSIRDELQELVDARESGSTYFLGQSQLRVRKGSSNLLKRLLITGYVFLDKNCREQSLALDTPHSALVKVGMIYDI